MSVERKNKYGINRREQSKLRLRHGKVAGVNRIDFLHHRLNDSAIKNKCLSQGAFRCSLRADGATVAGKRRRTHPSGQRTNSRKGISIFRE